MMIDLSHYLTKRVSLICALLILLIFIFRIVYFLTPAVPNPSFTRVVSISDDVAFTENTDNSRLYCQTVYYTPSPNDQLTINLIETSFPEISFIRIDKKADLLKYHLPSSSIILIQHLPQQKNDLTMKYLIELKQRLQLKLILFVHDLYFLYHYPSTAICPIISNMDAIYYNSSALKLQFERSCGSVAPNTLIAPSNHVVRQHSQLKSVVLSSDTNA